MARLFIPPPLRELTGNRQVVEVEAATVGQALDQVERLHPGVRARLVEGGQLRGISVTVDDAVAASGLRHAVDTDSEIHFLPAIGGG